MASNGITPAATGASDGLVTLEMINELQQQVLDNNPIYKYLLSDVSPPPSPPSPSRILHTHAIPFLILSSSSMQLVVTKVTPGYIEAQVPVSKTLMNSKSILHGSTSATIIDWIGGVVIASTSPDRFKNRGVSVDIHATYVGAAKEGDTLIIKGRSNKVGRNLAFIDVEILGRKQGGRETGEDDRVVVKGSHTKYVG